MGADLMLIGFRDFEATPERKAEMKEFVRGLSMEDMEEVVFFTSGEEINKSDDHESVARDNELVSEVKEQVYEVIDRVGDLRDYRDVSGYWINHEVGYHNITGGLSWGDAPTDTYPDFEFLSYTGLTDGLIEQYADEDAKKRREDSQAEPALPGSDQSAGTPPA